MTIKKILIIAFMSAICCLKVSAQDFFNLTAEQVRIDDNLPYFTHSFDLGKHYSDSVYTVEISYPEYIDMSDSDIKKYQAISSTVPGELPEISTYLGVGRKRGRLTATFVPVVYRDGKYQKLVSFMLLLKASPANTFEIPGASSLLAKSASALTRADDVSISENTRYADNSILQSGKWAKIRVAESGVYQLTETLIRQAGFNDLPKVKIYGYGGNLQPEAITESYITSTDDLTEVATCTIGGKRFFYGLGPVSWSGTASGTATNQRTRNPYSDYGYYFLTESDETPLSVDSATFISSVYPSVYDYNNIYEVDDYAWYHGGRNLYDSNLFGSGVSRDYTIESSSTSGRGYIIVSLLADASMTVTVSVNDSVVGTMRVSNPGSYDMARTSTSTFSVNNLTSSNKITITQNAAGNMRLDYISLHSNEPKAAPDLANGTFGTPEYVYNITNQNHHADTPVDMTIIIPTTQTLLEQAQRLKALHEQYDGMSVRIVPADELFNEFSSGTPDATAYRRYMKMLYDRATDDNLPKYLVLFGDCAWDNRMLTTDWTGYSPDDFLLCFESENSLSQTDCFVTDDYFCLLDDGEELYTSQGYTGQPDIAVGRFPVRTAAQAKIMVDKVERYLSNDNAGTWQNTIIFMGDDGNDNAHMEDAEAVAEIIEENYPSIDVHKVMWDAYKMENSSTGNSYPDARRLLQQYMASGSLIMNYSGHGSASQLSHEGVLTLADFEDISTTGLPLWVTASCDIMPFDGQEDNIGEVAVLNEKGGAIAFYGTARTVYQLQNSYMNQAFMNRVLATVDGKRISIGEAVRLAKDSLSSTVRSSSSGIDRYRDLTANKLQYSLLGDPAIVLAMPTMTAVIDSVNGIAPSADNIQTLKAGTKVKVEGHISSGDASGSVATDFNGVMTATIRGAKELITCQLNNTSDDGADRAFQFYNRSSTIYKGSDSISAGKFSFEFVVPKDITYSDETGQIIIYGINNSNTMQAHGSDENIVFNGTGELATDSIGPSVFCYLNSSAFVNGDMVNPTPYFVAEVNDASGINSTGTGIGHDIQLVIDNDASQTYTLNEYFTFDFGSYTSGTVEYSIPELTTGAHQLQFRIWDILNNSTTSVLTFSVANNIDPRLFSIDCSPNPATTSTTFRITHDRAGSDVDIVIELFDMSGRKLWQTSTTDESASSTSAVDWDLTIDGGRVLNTGVYLYRVKIACDGSNYVSQAKKLIVLSNK